MKKRLLSILLTLCMALSLLPAVVFAEGGAKAIQSGTGSIHGYNTESRYSYIYYGVWRNSPIKWRVLDTNANTGAAGALFLLTDECLYPLPGDLYDCYIQFNPTNKDDRYLWKGSTLQNWFQNTFYSGENSAFTSAERALIPATTQASSVFSYKAPGAPSWDPGMRFQTCALEAEHVFAPSIQDIFNAGYGFIDSTSRIAGPSNFLGPGTRYWLRSFEPWERLPFMVGENASLYGDSSGDSLSAVRPAMNLTTTGNNILFISAAVGGKPAGGLTEIGEYAGNDWKLTLKDDARSGFSVTTTNLSAYTRGGTVKLGYTGAKTGANEYVSAMILDAADNPAYYGRSSAALTDENGTAELTIPALAKGTYTLKVYNEQYNGDKMTDLASAFADVTLTVEEGVEEQFTLTPGGRYYFDLSALGIPGAVNSTLDGGTQTDGTLHYVPFTYVGTIDAYSMKSAADTDTQSYEHSLFIADYNVTHFVSWDALNEKGLIFGKTYASGSINYTMRAPSAGTAYNGHYGESGIPANNEWDMILKKAGQDSEDNTTGYIKNWWPMASWGQDSWSERTQNRTLRGYTSAHFCYSHPANDSIADLGYRPVLELPTDLAADSLKVVELITDGHMPGETYNCINIIVKKGESFKAPSAEGLPLSDGISADTPMWWVDENLNFYKPGDTVPADVSALSAFYGAFGLFLDRGDGEVEVTPDNYTDIFGDGTASFVLPKGRTYNDFFESDSLTESDRLEILATGRYGENIFPNLKLKNADLNSVTLGNGYIGQGSPLFITLDGKNTIGSLNGTGRALSTLSILGDGTLTMRIASRLSIYAQYGGNSVTVTDGLNIANALCIDSGSLTVTGDPQAVTLPDSSRIALYMDDALRLFLGSSAQDAVEAALPQLSSEMQALYERYQAGDTLTREDYIALSNALRERFNAIFQQLTGKTYVRFTTAWDVTYQPGASGVGSTVTDVKFYREDLTLRSALFTRPGYAQTGWATADGGEKVYAFGDIYAGDAALTLYPVWNLSQYTITYDLDGGTAEGNPVFYTAESPAITLNAPTKPGYIFTGWSGTGLTGENNLTVVIPTGSTGDRRYTAHWEFDPTIIAALNPTPNVDFLDVSRTDWFYYDVRYVCENGLMNGTSRNRFSPYGTATRGMLVTILYRLENEPRCFGGVTFPDVAPGAYYEKAVIWASQNSIVSGYTDGTFRPDAPVTREQLASILYRYTRYRGLDVSAGETADLSGYADVRAISDYALPAMRWACGAGILQGSNGKLQPSGLAARSQLAAMLHRYLKN